MVRITAITTSLVAFVSSTGAITLDSKRGFLSANMQPEVVARALSQVEDKWTTEATSFAECNATASEGADCSESARAFAESCSTIVSAVVKASSGDRASVSEYMGDICGQAELEGAKKEQCQGLAEEIVGAMTEDNYDNRENLNVASLCAGFWTRFSASEQVRAARAGAERVAAEKKAQEEKLAAEKKAEEEEAARQAAEEQARQQQELEQKQKAADEAAAALNASAVANATAKAEDVAIANSTQAAEVDADSASVAASNSTVMVAANASMPSAVAEAASNATSSVAADAPVDESTTATANATAAAQATPAEPENGTAAAK